jgi:hypothetical protein
MVVMFVRLGLYPIPDEAKEPDPESRNGDNPDDAHWFRKAGAFRLALVEVVI